MDKQLFTTNEAAELLGVTPARVRQMVARDEIESEKMGRDRFITAQAIAAAQQRKTSPGPVPKAKTDSTPAPAETTAKLNKAFRAATEADQEASKVTASEKAVLRSAAPKQASKKAGKKK